jgi:hypothetical protein
VRSEEWVRLLASGSGEWVRLVTGVVSSAIKFHINVGAAGRSFMYKATTNIHPHAKYSEQQGRWVPPISDNEPLRQDQDDCVMEVSYGSLSAVGIVLVSGVITVIATGWLTYHWFW